MISGCGVAETPDALPFVIERDLPDAQKVQFLWPDVPVAETTPELIEPDVAGPVDAPEAPDVGIPDLAVPLDSPVFDEGPAQDVAALPVDAEAADIAIPEASTTRTGSQRFRPGSAPASSTTSGPGSRSGFRPTAA